MPEILIMIARACLGLSVFIFIAWLMSTNRKLFPWRVVLGGLGLQLLLAVFVLGTSVGRSIFNGLAWFVRELIALNLSGSKVVFGGLADPGSTLGFVFAFAGTGLIAIIFFASLLAVLYHLGIMQVIIWAMARVMSATMRVSGAESLAMAANVFVGQTESPLVVRPYLLKMTQSELAALMTGGFATIAGSVLAIYLGIVTDALDAEAATEMGKHFLAASVMSAPAAFLIAKVMFPETETPATRGSVPLKIKETRTAGNLVEAAADGASEGMKLWLNVIAMLVAFLALIELINWPLGQLTFPSRGIEQGDITLASIFGIVFSPLAWVMGVDGWHDMQRMGSLMGLKIAANEFVAYGELATITTMATSAVDEANQQQLTLGFESPRAAQLAIYALCGFANFGSVGIQIGGIAALVPERKADIARIALRCMIGGAMASWMTATVAGMFILN